jgi:hypothetical protein
LSAVHQQEFRDFAQRARAFAARIQPGRIPGSVLYGFPTPQPGAAELREIAEQINAAADAIDAYLRRPR